MKVRILAPAAAEFREAIAWYRATAPAAAEAFIQEIRIARARIVEHPHAWHRLGSDTRRFRLRRFPYGVIYAVEPEVIVIVAIAHLHREPEYWRDRFLRE